MLALLESAMQDSSSVMVTDQNQLGMNGVLSDTSRPTPGTQEA